MTALDYRALFEAAPSLYLVLNPAFEIVAVNDAYLQATMTQRDLILGRRIFDVFPDNPDDPHADGVRNLQASLLRVLDTGRPDAMAIQKYDIQRPESQGGGFEARYWSPVNSPIFDASGAVCNIIHRVEDVTDFVRLKEELQHRAHDTELQRVEAEHMATEIFTRSQQLGEANRQLQAANDGLVRLYNDVAAMVVEADAALKLRPDAPGLISDPSQLNPEELLIQVERLISGHRRLESELRQAQKMEAIGRLAGGIAHDFNNILTIILGQSNLLLARIPPQDPIHRKLSGIRDAGQMAAELTNQLLVFSRSQVFEPKVVNLAATLKDMDRLLRRVLGEDVETATVIDGAPGMVRIDPSQFQQVVMNLVVNARDAMPRGGKLTIELKNAVIPPGSTPHFDVPPGDYVALAVTDNGVGMSAEVKQKAFEPFFTTKEAGRGTGLGLATVYGIAKQSGGHIWLYSEPGTGTTIRIFLPRVDESPASLYSPAASLRSSGSETVLVVEDDQNIRSLVEEVLSGEGYTVLTASHGDEALRLCERTPGEIHLMLTDVVLPRMSGKEVAQRVRRSRPNIKVLFMSGYTGDAMAHHDIVSEPSLEFLQKPFVPDALCGKVRTVLNTSQRSPSCILVVDDMPAVLDLVSSILEDAGYRVITAGGGREALDRAGKIRIDLVVTDLSMPDGEGIATIRALRREYPNLKIIAMSGAFGPEILRVAQTLGADAALAKPLNEGMLLECVRKLINERGRENGVSTNAPSGV